MSESTYPIRRLMLHVYRFQEIKWNSHASPNYNDLASAMATVLGLEDQIMIVEWS